MKIIERTGKPVVGCSKNSFEITGEADVVWRDFQKVFGRNEV